MCRKGIDRIKIIPKYYFVVSGAALSTVSPLNAFDGALKEAGIHNLNLVEAFSILPKDVINLELTREEVVSLFEPLVLQFSLSRRHSSRKSKYDVRLHPWAHIPLADEGCDG